MKIPIKKERYLIIGLMSGTSHDGIDAALTEIIVNDFPTGDNIIIRFIAHSHIPFSEKEKLSIRKVFGKCSSEDICRLNFDLGHLFAKTALKLIKDTNYTPADIDAISSHGQTIYHIPPDNQRVNNQYGSTLQIGEPSVIAYETGILTISDFRTKDMAAKGQGAPLVPISDFFLFRQKGKKRVVLNIGGMANVTVIGDLEQDTIAFDTGPGNALIDEAVRIHTNNERQFDEFGEIAKNNAPDVQLLDTLISNPFFKIPPPKSTGREIFGKRFTEDIFLNNYHLSEEVIISTLTHLTANSITDAVIPYFPDEVIVTGGGIRNLTLMSLIKQKLDEKNIDLNCTDKYGVPYQAKEAVSFAFLGYRTLNLLHGNIASCTGADKNVILGKITFP